MAFTEGSADGVTNGTTAVTMVAAPAASTRRLVKTLTIANTDTASATVKIYLLDGANARLIISQLLLVGQSLILGRTLVLDATNKSITIKLAGAVTTSELDWTSHYADVS